MTEKKKIGFALLSPEQRKAAASLGGRSVPAEKRAFSVNKDHARKCGFKGGKAVRPENRTFARDPEKAQRAGRLGGLVRQGKAD